MLDVTPTPLQRLLRERRRGYSLPAEFHLSPEVFEADMAVIFDRRWIYVGVEPDVPEAGDVMVVDIGKTSVAIVRDDDGAVRAFHNVFRDERALSARRDPALGVHAICEAEALGEQLGVASGAVSPLAALNAAPGSVRILIQDSLLTEARINVHPLVSTRTLNLKPDVLLAALRAEGHAPEPFALPEAARAA